VIAYSRGYLIGWQRGYSIAAGHRLGRLRLASFSLLFFSMIAFGAGLGFFWTGAEFFYQLSIGEPAKKVVIGKWDAWNRVHRKVGQISPSK